MITKPTNRRALFALTLWAAALSISPLHAQSLSPDTNAAPPPDKKLILHLVDAQSSIRIAGAKVHASFGLNAFTDATGSCSLEIPHPTDPDFIERVTFSKDGYVAKYILWSKARGDKFDDIPAEYTAKLDPAVSVGGVVKGGDGKPLGGVRVIISGIDTSPDDAREKTTMGSRFDVEVTDDHGHWEFAQAPEQFQDLTYRVLVPDYPAVTFGSAGSAAGGADVTRISQAALRAGTAEMSLSRGFTLAGIVVDQQGKPVPAAQITRNREWNDRKQTVQSDADGHFKIADLQPGDLVLTIQAKGFEAQTRSITAAKDMPELRLVLYPGRILKGRVLDSDGQPVAGASISTDHIGSEPLEYDWHSTSDKEGRFVWDSAPSGPHPYLITAQGYSARVAAAWEADGAEKSVSLHKFTTNAVVDGHLTDDSGQPVDRFTLVLRVATPKGVTNFVQDVNNNAGHYAIEIDRHSIAYTLEFRGKNFVPTHTETLFPADGDLETNLQVTSALPNSANILTGTLMLPDGPPAAGADIALCTETLGVELSGRHLKGIYQTNITATGPDGSFAFRADPTAHTIIAACQDGYAQLDITELASPFKITLQRWGSISGVATQAGHPLNGETIALQGPPPNPVAAGLTISPLDYAATTDAAGKFSFPDIPPTDLRLGRMINGFFHNADYITVQPGAPTTIQYGGGSESVVTAHLAVPGYTNKIHWGGDQSIVLTTDVAEPNKPKFDSPEDEKVWVGQFLKSPAGLAWQKQQRGFVASPKDDGSFQIEDVPPGNYKLRIQLREAAEFGGQALARLETNFTVPPPAESNSVSTLDLGTINVPQAISLRPGDLAPPFEVKTIFGHPLKLADYRGKFVLLDFWATWCGPCVAEIPSMKQVYDTFGQDPRFAMISLSLDPQTAQPVEFIHEKDIRWEQGFLGDWNDTPVPELYGVDAIPQVFLIGPDGKIIARDLRGPAVAEAVSKALHSN